MSTLSYLYLVFCAFLPPQEVRKKVQFFSENTENPIDKWYTL